MKRKREKFKYDPNQAKFGSDGDTHAYTSLRNVTVDFDETHFCPHCLYQDTFRKFYSTEGMVHCPDCERNMRVSTLIKWKKASPEQFAEWVFKEATYGTYWKGVDWDVWKDRLDALGWSKLFWDKYKQLKAELSQKIDGPSSPESSVDAQYAAFIDDCNKQHEKIGGM